MDTYCPDPAKVQALYQSLAIAEDCVRFMVIDELTAQVLPELEEAEAVAAGELREAVAALQKPEEALSELERDIATAEGECLQFSSQLHSESISSRIAARAAYSEWSAELDTLTGKRNDMERDIMPLREASPGFSPGGLADRRADRKRCS
jgi:hypothetical protein